MAHKGAFGTTSAALSVWEEETFLLDDDHVADESCLTQRCVSKQSDDGGWSEVVEVRAKEIHARTPVVEAVEPVTLDTHQRGSHSWLPVLSEG